jgi:sugar-specific transcriptional regulator TrmB
LELDKRKSPSFTRTYDSNTSAGRYVRTGKHFNEHLSILEKALSRYGLSANEVKTYLYLAGVSEKKAAEISESVSLHRTETYKVLHDLEKRGLVISVFGKPVKFAAVPPYRGVEQLLETEKIRIKLLEKEKLDFIAVWSSIPKRIDDVKSKEVMQALEGRPQIILKAKELLKKSNWRAQIFAPDHYLTLLVQGDFIDCLRRCSYDKEIDLLVENSLKSRLFCEQIGWTNYMCCFLVSDEKELLMIYVKDVEVQRNIKRMSRMAALWTNCLALVESQRVLFSELSGCEKDFRDRNEALSPELNLKTWNKK